MINIEEIIQNLKTDLEGLSWNFDSNAQVTSFQTVYSAPKFVDAGNSPWACINDEPFNLSKRGTRSKFGASIYSASMPISIYICANFNAKTLSLQEATKRIRHASKAVFERYKDGAVMDNLGMPGWNIQGWEPYDPDEIANLISRRITLQAFDKL